MISIPFGSAIFISPSAGLSSVIILLLTLLYFYLGPSRDDAVSFILLHQNLRKTLKMKETNIW